MDGHEVEFIPADWVERAFAWPGLTVYSRPIIVERRCNVRQSNDRIEKLLRTLLEVPDAA